jgi:hypothetical protein
MWIRPQLYSPRLLRVIGRARRVALIRPGPPPPPPSIVHFSWPISRDWGWKGGWPLSIDLKVMQLDSDSFCDHIQIWGEVVGRLGAEIDFFLVKCRRLPRLLFDAAPLWPRPRGPKGAHLKEESKRNRFPLYSSLIRVLGDEQSAPIDRRKFSEKGSKCRRPPTFCIGRLHFGMFWTGRAGTTSRASTADMPPI